MVLLIDDMHHMPSYINLLYKVGWGGADSLISKFILMAPVYATPVAD